MDKKVIKREYTEYTPASGKCLVVNFELVLDLNSDCEVAPNYVIDMLLDQGQESEGDMVVTKKQMIAESFKEAVAILKTRGI